MRDLLQYAFDFFAYVLPGLVILFALSLLFIPIEGLDDLFEKTEKINTGIATVAVIVSYIIGFAIYPFGRHLYRTLGFKIWKKKILNDVDLFVSDKFALVREKSPANFKYIEIWNIYCAMSHNFAISSAVLFIVCLIKLAQNNTNWMIWAGLGVFTIFLFFVFLHRAVIFFHWSAHDMNATISRLKLDGKPTKKAGKKK